MPQFELGGSVSPLTSDEIDSLSINSDQAFTSNFARELAKESLKISDATFKSDFATELFETSLTCQDQSQNEESINEGNIYENVNFRESIGSATNPFLDNSSDFRRISQVKYINKSIFDNLTNNLWFSLYLQNKISKKDYEELTKGPKLQGVRK